MLKTRIALILVINSDGRVAPSDLSRCPTLLGGMTEKNIDGRSLGMDSRRQTNRICGRQMSSSAPDSDIENIPGGYNERVTPVPIPNTEVKPLSVDGTARETEWESRSLPV